MAEANFSGSSAYTGILNVNGDGGWELLVRKNSGNGYYTANSYSWAVSINGANWGGSWSYDFRNTSLIRIANQDSHGGYPRPLTSQNVGASWSVNMQSPIGNSSGNFAFWANGTASAPNTPNAPSVNVQSPTQMTATWNVPAANGSAITQYDFHVCENTAFDGSNCPWYNWVGNTTTKTVTNLVPGRTYYARVRAQNAAGTSAWSGTTAFTMFASTGPGIAVTPSPAGGSAEVRLSPPTGMSSVSSYALTWTYQGPLPLPTPSSWSQTVTSSPVTIQGLVPGATYLWSATANISGYISPASSVTTTQPSPSVNAGSFFDGNTTDTTDAVYAWTGTTNNSTSTVTAPQPTGWMTFGDGNSASGGTGAVSRAAGGAVGNFSARVTFFSDATAQGFVAGQAYSATARTEVEPGSTYWGQIQVFIPNRTQRMAVMLAWYTAAGAFISNTTGIDTLIPAGQYTRISVIGTAPLTAEYAAVRVRDVSGTSWATWKSGDTFNLDAAMISLGELYPYFDGDTEDAPQFDFQWTGAANASTSFRADRAVASNDLVDPDCPPVPPAPRPPIIPSDCIVDVGLWRRVWATVPAGNVSDWLTTIPTVVIKTGGFAERQVRIRYFPNPFSRAPGDIDNNDFCAEQILSYIPALTEMTLDGITERVWAEVNGGPSQGADHLLYGSNGTPATWPQLSCGIPYLVSIDVPVSDGPDGGPGNVTVEMFVTQRV